MPKDLSYFNKPDTYEITNPNGITTLLVDKDEYDELVDSYKSVLAQLDQLKNEASINSSGSNTTNVYVSTTNDPNSFDFIGTMGDRDW